MGCQAVLGPFINNMKKGKYIRTEEHKNKMAIIQKTSSKCIAHQKSSIGRKVSIQTKSKLSTSLLGKYKRYGINNPFYGKKHSNATRLKMSTARRGRKPNWKGGIIPSYILIRTSKKYERWRSEVFIRDNFTCQKCKDKTGGNLNAHHIKPFIKLLDEVKKYLPLFNLYDGAMLYSPLWDISNGITLCQKCHKKEKRRTR